MAKREIKRKLNEAKPEQIFELGKRTFESLGFEIFKTRPFAFLIQARKSGESGMITANLIANAFLKEFTLTVKSEGDSQDSIDKLAEEILEKLDRQLGV